MVVYFANILIYSFIFEKHLQHIREVLQAL